MRITIILISLTTKNFNQMLDEKLKLGWDQQTTQVRERKTRTQPRLTTSFLGVTSHFTTTAEPLIGRTWVKRPQRLIVRVVRSFVRGTSTIGRSRFINLQFSVIKVGRPPVELGCNRTRPWPRRRGWKRWRSGSKYGTLFWKINFIFIEICSSE